MSLKKELWMIVSFALLVFVGQASAGLNAGATLSLDLIAGGGAGNRIDDGVTSGTVSGQGAKIAVEVFAQGVTTSLVGVQIEFEFDAAVLQFDKAENSAFTLAIPTATGINLAATGSVALPESGFLARAEFTTVVDVTNKEFTLGIKSVTLAESATSSDVITTTNVISFNAMISISPDFDGSGIVDFPDFLLFVGQFGARQGDGTYGARYDLDGNGAIDFSDFLIFANSFGKRISSDGGGGEMVVSIPDADLRAVIAAHLGKLPDASITRTEMASLTYFDASNSISIRTLTGLEFATNLKQLDLSGNSLENISPLSGLTNLEGLYITGSSHITDISPLSNLTNLTILNLRGNGIIDISPLSNLTNLEELSLGGNVFVFPGQPLR